MGDRITTRERKISTRERGVTVIGSKSSSSEDVSYYANMQNDPSWYGGGGKEQKSKNTSWFGQMNTNHINAILKENADILES